MPRPVTDLKRRVAPFHVVTEMTPAGDQPAAIADIGLDNSGSLAELDREVGDLWAELCRRANAAQEP